MKNLAAITFYTLFFLLPLNGAEKVKPHSARPKEGFVPTEQIAIQIAVAIWTPIYGKKNIARQAPYKANLKNGVWHVVGHLPNNKVGGVAIAEIQKSDAKIIRISHSK